MNHRCGGKDPVPLCLAVHDICAYGKSSLSVVLPVMEALGVEVCPLPTAVLSTQTDGFEDVYIRSLDDSILPMASRLEEEGLRFDCLYTGFLSTVSIVGHVERLRPLLRDGGLFVVDPVLGDKGALYGGLDAAMVGAVRTLVGGADLATPNWTEACLLTGLPYEERPARGRILQALEMLGALAPRAEIALTGLEDNGSCEIFCRSPKMGRTWSCSHRREPRSFPGCGDFFASVLTALLLRGENLERAVSHAGDATAACVRATENASLETRHGLCPALWLAGALDLAEGEVPDDLPDVAVPDDGEPPVGERLR